MATTNPVFQVLATSGDQAILAAGSRPDALAVGQLGIFNYHTGLSIDGTVPANAKDIVIMVGIDPDGVGSLQDIRKSAGQMIQVRNAKSLTVKGYLAEIQKVVEVTGFKAKCDTDYALKLEFRNHQIYGLQGTNQFAKTFAYRTSCCTDTCDTCPTGDTVELAKGLADNINADADGLVVAALFGNKRLATVNTAPTADGTILVAIGTETFEVAILDADTATQVAAKIAAAINATTGSAYVAGSAAAVLTVYTKVASSNPAGLISISDAGGTGMTIDTTSVANETITDTEAFSAAYPGAGLGIRITGVAQARPNFNGSIPVKYFKQGTDFTVSTVLDAGFNCNSTITTITEAQFPEGKGLDLAQLEYVAAGHNGSIYRQSALLGLEKGDMESIVVKATNYNVVSLTYDQLSVAGWDEHLNNLETIIAIPCADTTTLTGLATVLDLIFTQFGAMANDVAAMDCTNTQVHTIDNPATDGIESLA